MGNAESSPSELNPTSSRRRDESSFSSTPTYGRSESKKSGEEGESSSISSLLMAGAAAVGTAGLLLYGAKKLATSSSDASDDSDDRKVAHEITGNVQKSYGAAGAGVFNRYSYREFQEGSPTFKFMTYNVWIQEGVARDRRIKAVCNLIRQHSPDVIMLQEVTPNMMKIFRNSEWLMDRYKYMLPEETPQNEGSFCIMMSSSPMKVEWIELHSLDKTKFCVASINVMGKTLVSATCHLKSPSPPKKQSEELRKKQANELLRELDDSWPNVVVGGDMNWTEDDVKDWPAPWVDAWTKLKPGGDGYTYDTVGNKMIANGSKVQKRLDRFICKLKDFKPKDIEIIGTKAIDDEPGIYRSQDVPVFTSDHFGLVLTISAI